MIEGANVVIAIVSTYFFILNGDRNMYAVVALFKAVPGNHEAILKIDEQSIEHLKNQKGFKNSIFFSDQEKNEYGAITVWETEDGFDNYFKAYSPEELEKIGSLFSETIMRNKYYINKIYSLDQKQTTFSL